MFSITITFTRAASRNPGRVSTFALVLLVLAIDDDRQRAEKRRKKRGGGAPRPARRPKPPADAPSPF